MGSRVSEPVYPDSDSEDSKDEPQSTPEWEPLDKPLLAAAVAEALVGVPTDVCAMIAETLILRINPLILPDAPPKGEEACLRSERPLTTSWACRVDNPANTVLVGFGLRSRSLTWRRYLRPSKGLVIRVSVDLELSAVRFYTNDKEDLPKEHVLRRRLNRYVRQRRLFVYVRFERPTLMAIGDVVAIEPLPQGS